MNFSIVLVVRCNSTLIRIEYDEKTTRLDIYLIASNHAQQIHYGLHNTSASS